MSRPRLLMFAGAALASAILVTAGCARPAGPATTTSPVPATSTGTASPDPSTSPTADPTLLVWQLRYRLLGHYLDFAYCDPDYYPVARDDEQSAADDWWASADRGSPEVRAILGHLGLHEPLAAAARLSTYRDHKKLAAISMQPVTGGYEYQLATGSGGEPDHTVEGVISVTGAIQERSRSPRPGGCPICLEASTRIATPEGEVPVAALRPGDVVWTAGADGTRVAAPVQRVVRRATPGPHLMLRVVLSDARELVVAGAHPGVGVSYLRGLRPGARYDGATVVSAGWETSTAAATYDLLPEGATGYYWANGILVASTLRHPRSTTAAGPALGY